MKTIKSLLGVIGIIAFLMTGCSKEPRVFENPIINYSNTNNIDVVKVELTDTATILDVKAFYRPHYWIKIAASSCLLANGKKYPIIRGKGIELDKEFWMPDSGKASFSLIFEPIPFNTDSFDFYEDYEHGGGWELLGIDISGKEYRSYPEGLPKEIKEIKAATEFPDISLTQGRTTVNVHLLPTSVDLGKNGWFLLVNSIDGSQEEYPIIIDKEGNAPISFDQYGTATGFVVNENLPTNFGEITLLPGENVDVYVDLRKTGIATMMQRANPIENKVSRALHNGHYARFDKLKNSCDYYQYDLDYTKSPLNRYDLTGEEFMTAIKEEYNNMLDSINCTDYPEAIKQLMISSLQNEVIGTVANIDRLMIHNYYRAHNNWGEPIHKDSIKTVIPDDLKSQVTTWFDLNNPNLLFTGTYIGNLDWNSLGAKGDFSRSINRYKSMAHKAKRRTLTEADIDSLKMLSNSFFAEACDSIQQRSIRSYNELIKKTSLETTPDVPNDRLFDAIIAPHKGKVVVVDLWNTWCGPCRKSLVAYEHLKDGELDSKDIVWIYIADESSNQTKYLSMLPDIKGLHYMLTAEQKKAIADRFNVDGIPYYIIVDRQGNAEGRPDLRDHSKYIKTIKSLL